jgi:hypothetical protein
MIAALRPNQATTVWDWLLGRQLVTPLNNVESLALSGAPACQQLIWNSLKGSWNLGLQTLGWGRLLVGPSNPLYDAMRNNALLSRGYATLVGGGTPTSATLNGTVGLQGLSPGTSGYLVALDLRLFQPGTSNVVGTFQATTDGAGGFSVGGITPGTYDVEVKETRRLGRIARNLTLAAGVNTRAFGDLLAGDVNGDDAVSLVDYSRLRASYGRCAGDTGYQPGADLTGDGCVTLPDYSRLRANYGMTGPLSAP